jgi:hypothetical protein
MRDERQQQLTSNWLNIMAAGTVSGGIVSQLIAMGSGASVRNSIMLVLLCIAAGSGLHLAALRCLRNTGRDR